MISTHTHWIIIQLQPMYCCLQFMHRAYCMYMRVCTCVCIGVCAVRVRVSMYVRAWMYTYIYMYKYGQITCYIK